MQINYNYSATSFVLLLLILQGCAQLAPPRSPHRPVLTRVQLSAPKVAAIDSFTVELEVKKGRYDVYLVTETVRKSYRVKSGERLTDLLSIDALLGDPDLNKRVESEYISLPLKVKLIDKGKTVNELKTEIDCFAGYNVPGNSAIPLNNLGTIKYSKK